MKLLKLFLFIVIFLSIVAISGCLEGLRGTVNMEEINSSLFGPGEIDIPNE